MSRPLPWTLRDLGRLVTFEVVSVIAILTCFVGARHTTVWAHQLYWVVGGIGALLLAGAGWAVWVLLGARALRARQSAMVVAVTPLLSAPAPVVASAEPQLISAPGMVRYHREGCLFLRTGRGRAASLKVHLDAGRQPCGVCRP